MKKRKLLALPPSPKHQAKSDDIVPLENKDSLHGDEIKGQSVKVQVDDQCHVEKKENQDTKHVPLLPIAPMCRLYQHGLDGDILQLAWIRKRFQRNSCSDLKSKFKLLPPRITCSIDEIVPMSLGPLDLRAKSRSVVPVEKCMMENDGIPVPSMAMTVTMEDDNGPREGNSAATYIQNVKSWLQQKEGAAVAWNNNVIMQHVPSNVEDCDWTSLLTSIQDTSPEYYCRLRKLISSSVHPCLIRQVWLIPTLLGTLLHHVATSEAEIMPSFLRDITQGSAWIQKMPPKDFRVLVRNARLRDFLGNEKGVDMEHEIVQQYFRHRYR